MLAKLLPIISWDDAPSKRPDNWHSVVIAFARALAAIEVAASHLRAMFYPGMRTISDPPLWYQGFAFLTGFGHQAVLLFFVISGWLVGGSLLDKWHQRDALTHYTIDRATRLWTVMIPVFGLSVLLGLASTQLDGSKIDVFSTGEFSALTFLGNLIGLQLMAVPNFGGNFPLWSLSNETWYYVLFPLVLIGVRGPHWGARALSTIAVLVLIFTLKSTIILYFLIWLLGAAGSRVQIRCSRAFRVAIITVAVLSSVYCRLTGLNDDISFAAFVPDLILSLFFLIILCTLRHSPSPRQPAARALIRAGRYFAEFSFTLYLIHVPLIQAFQGILLKVSGLGTLSPHEPLHLLLSMLMLCLLTLGAWLFYLLFESHTPQIRRWAKTKVLGTTKVNGVGASAGP